MMGLLLGAGNKDCSILGSTLANQDGNNKSGIVEGL